MFCRNCGAEIKDNAFMCVHCGVQTCDRIIPTFTSFNKCGLSKEEVTLPCKLTSLQVDERMCNLSRFGAQINVVGRNVLPNGFEYCLSTEIGLCSWGELMYVKVEKSSVGSIVNIFSKCAFPAQIVAWGKHGRNIKKIMNALEME